MTALRVIQGGRGRPSTARLAGLLRANDALRLELLSARSERTVLASRLREHVRSAMRAVASGHLAAAGTALVECARLVEQEAVRASRMDVPACACGMEGPGHGHAEDEEMAA